MSTQYNTDFIREYWKKSLQPVNLRENLSVLLATETREYLKQVGLPSREKVEFQFQEQFAFDKAEITTFTFMGSVFVALKEQYPETLGLKQSCNKVYVIYKEPPPILAEDMEFEPILSVNSNLSYYIIFSTLFLKGSKKRYELFQKYTTPIPNASRKEVIEKRQPIKLEFMKHIQHLRDQFYIIDKSVMSEDKNWWKQKLFDLETMF